MGTQGNQVVQLPHALANLLIQQPEEQWNGGRARTIRNERQYPLAIQGNQFKRAC